MVQAAKRITVAADSELAQALREARRLGRPLLLDFENETYRVEASSNVEDWPDPDPEKVREILDRVIGSWADLDIDAEIEAVYKAREEGSRPADWP